MIKYIVVLLNAILVFFIAKLIFKHISGQDSIFLLNMAPAGVIMIYAIGYFMIMNISLNYSNIYRKLVGTFVIIAILIHSATINIALESGHHWGIISLLIGLITLFSTIFIVTIALDLDFKH